MQMFVVKRVDSTFRHRKADVDKMVIKAKNYFVKNSHASYFHYVRLIIILFVVISSSITIRNSYQVVFYGFPPLGAYNRNYN